MTNPIDAIGELVQEVVADHAQFVGVVLLIVLAAAETWRWWMRNLPDGSPSREVDPREIESLRDSPRHCRSPRRLYERIGPAIRGDLCDVWPVMTTEIGRCLLKIPRVDAANDLLDVERDVLQSLHGEIGGETYRDYLPSPVEAFTSGKRRINAYRLREGFRSAESILARHPHGVDDRHLAWMFRRMLEILGRVHACGWVHGAVLPPHLLFQTENHGLQLVDWIHAVRIGSPLRIRSERYADWYPPECHERRPARSGTDLFLTARSLIWLSGRDPLGDALPDTVPAEFRRLVEYCLVPSIADRPRSAWELHDELTSVLRRAYGSPAFHRLDMS